MSNKMKLAAQISTAQRRERERERNVALPDRMFLLLCLLWLALNLALIIQCLSLNNLFIYFLILGTPYDVFAYPRGYAYPRINTTALDSY
jgi:hypothetical protein